jgi:uncharacterized protein
MTTLGVLADTHIPDRVPKLHPRVFEVFQQVQVKAILHAGDVSVPQVLDDLKKIAPVYAVRGNRDIFALRDLPLQIQVSFDGIVIGMAHGHGTFNRYMVDKIKRAIHGRLAESYLSRMLETFPEVDVIIFGHLHVPCNFHLEGKLLLNPGTTSYPWPRSDPATFGLLHIYDGREPQGEIITLE